jgi:hypothetical protein
MSWSHQSIIIQHPKEIRSIIQHPKDSLQYRDEATEAVTCDRRLGGGFNMFQSFFISRNIWDNPSH